MPWTIELIDEYQIIETIYVGGIPGDELQAAALANLEMSREKNTWLFLGDCTKAESGQSLFDIYQLVAFFESVNLPHDMKEAIVLPISSEAVSDLQFYETVAQNRGYNVRVFNNRTEAVGWLKKH